MRKVRVIAAFLAMAGLALAVAALAAWFVKMGRTLVLGLVLLCAMASMF